MPATTVDKVREENHTMLIQLKDSVGNIGASLSNFVDVQGKENIRINGRIDAQGESMARAVGSIKDSISDRSRITPALIAMVLSSIAILGGAFTAYIGLQTAPIRSDIANEAQAIATMEAQRLQMRQNLVELQVKSAEENARQRECQRWTEKLQDERRNKNTN